MLLDLLQPVLDIGEGFLAGDVVAEEDAVGAAVENASDRAERLLAGRVPNLQLHDLPVQPDHERFRWEPFPISGRVDSLANRLGVRWGD